MGGSSKKVTVGYKYYLGKQLALCHGPIDAITRAVVDGKTAWLGFLTGGRMRIDKPGLFGGTSREGGVKGDIDIEMGYPDQPRNDYLQSQLGDDIPAFRGVLSAVFRQVYLGNNPYLKRWSFRGQRCHIRQNGVPQWYDEKSAIPHPQNSENAVSTIQNFVATSASAEEDGGNNGYLISGLKPEDVLFIYPNANASSGFDGFSYLPDDSGPEAYWAWTTSVYYGGQRHEFWPTRYPTKQQAYEAAAASPIILTGHSEYRVFIYDPVPGNNRDGISLHIRTDSIFDLNPAHIIRECLTDPDWGMGYPESDIDDASFRYAADTLFDENMGISLLWDRQIPIEEFVDEIKKHIAAEVYVDNVTGKFVIKLIRADYDAETILHLDELSITKVEYGDQPAFGELTNSVTVNYWNSETGKTASVTANDAALILTQGAVINTTVQYPGFTNADIGGKAALRDLQVLSRPLQKRTIYADRTAADLNIGAPFKVTWPKFDMYGVVMRVQKIELGDGRRHQVRITAIEDSFAFPSVATVLSNEDDNEVVDVSVSPAAADQRLLLEAPYYEMAQLLGDQGAEDRLSTAPEAGFVIAAAARPSGALSARFWLDPGAGYEDVASLDFCPSGQLTEDITPLTTTWLLGNHQDLEEVEIGSHAQLGGELVRVDAVDFETGSITVGRGVLDTVPAAHNAGETVYFWDAYGATDEIEYVDSDTIDGKITPISGLGELSIDSAPSDTLVLSSRAVRPYPPGNFMINGLSYPSEYILPADGIADLSWAHRDRLSQTGGTIQDHTSGDIGPEPGTTYLVTADAELSDGSSVVAWLSTDVGALKQYTFDESVTPPPAGAVKIIFKVFSVRDSYLSMQAASVEVSLFVAPHNLAAQFSPFVQPANVAAVNF